MRVVPILNLMLVILSSYVSGQESLNLVRLQEAAKEIVALNNDSRLIPLQDQYSKKIAVLHFEPLSLLAETKMFDSIANKYSKVTSFHVGEELAGGNGSAAIISVGKLNDSLAGILHDKLKLFDLLIFTITGDVAFKAGPMKLMEELGHNRQLIFVYRGKGENLPAFDKVSAPLIWCSSVSRESAGLAPQLIFGGISSGNKLTRSYGKKFVKGSGSVVAKSRLGYGIPESVSLQSDFLVRIDSIVEAGIRAHVTPGAVVLLIKDNTVIFDRAYGKHTYNDTILTKVDDIFDMASVTKVTATTPVIMQLYDRKQLALDTPISKYVYALRTTSDKREQTIKEALLHEAGFTPYIKFFEKLGPLDLSFKRSAEYPTELADNFFLRKNYFEEVMWPVTLQSPVLTRGRFVYSDVSMYMLKQVAENITHRALDEYVLSEFYQPLGMKSTGFRPRERFDISQIVPTTENDNWLRNMRVTGFVNDPGAAMSGGVQGHAGLFSTTNDLAIYYQMLLNKGSYGGRKYFEPSTVELFTSRQSAVSNRGLGFAKPVDTLVPASGYPSKLSFGHSGYTGTYVWVDPAYDLIYIFLSNRVYPDDGKTYGPAKINVRAEVLNTYYEAVLKKKQ